MKPNTNVCLYKWLFDIAAFFIVIFIRYNFEKNSNYNSQRVNLKELTGKIYVK